MVDEIRKWFIENNYTVERYENGEINDTILTNHFNSIFPEKYNIERITRSQIKEGDFKWYVERKSKGPIQIEQKFDNEEFLKNIDDLIVRREMLCGSPTMQNLSKYDFLVEKEDFEIKTKIFESIDNGFLKMVDKVFLDTYGIENLRKFWRNHLEIKRIATNQLSEYFKWTYNYNIQTFKEVFLDDFNLKPCHLCYGI
ncbi:hypothetical protein [Bergeyella sp. RCAD1439]|uniref:hypothetical protein n=1 Tax=Bergeyella anatis TaxID=3113737 RepID=UPI002E183EA7|nr:hypothetical protein [Bergeyella sp. RCAD1439]